MSVDAEKFAETLLNVVGRSRSTRDRARTRSAKVTNLRAVIAPANGDRSKLVIENESASDIEIGGPDLAFGEGIKIRANGGAYIDDVQPFLGEWWAVAAVAGPLDVRVRDES